MLINYLVKKSCWGFVLFCFCVLTPLSTLGAASENLIAGEGSANQTVVTAPVIVDGITLLRVRGVSSFPATRRAREIAARIEQLAENELFDPESLKITEEP